MRCYNCRKNFDYEKYYGICPKCGCFNKKETAEEEHEALHDRFSDSSDEEDGCTYMPYERETAGKKGAGLFVFGVLFFILSVFLLIGSALYLSLKPGNRTAAYDAEHGLELIEHETAGKAFSFQNALALDVLECKEVANHSTLPDLEEGKKVVAVHLRGTGDGMYENYNSIYGMYLSAGNGYLKSISSYAFEPYARMLGAYPVLDGDALRGSDSCDGWIPFLIPEEADTAVLWLDEYDGSDWDGGNLLRTHRIELDITPLGSPADRDDTQGGADDAG